MEPGVPFALLGSVQLLAVAAWTGLAGAALALSRRATGSRWAGALAALGALVLTVADIRTGIRFGDAASDDIAFVRCAGGLLLAAGLYAGALAARPADVRIPATALPAVGALPLAGVVVVPLGAAPAPAALAGGALLAAALASYRSLRGRAGLALAVGLVLSAVAAGLGPVAEDSPSGAVAATVVRGAGAALVLLGLVALASASLLAKVVAAILAGVLTMAAAAVGVVGTVVSDSFDEQAASLVEQAAQGRLQALSSTGEAATTIGLILQGVFERSPSQVPAFLAQGVLGRGESFAVNVGRDGKVELLGGKAPLSTAEALALGQDRVVRFALEETGADALRSPQPFLVRLQGAAPSVALVVLVPADRPTPDSPAPAVFVFGQRLGDAYAADDFDAGGYGLSFLVGDRIVASNLSAEDERRLQDIARDEDVGSGIPGEGVTVPASGESPTVRFVPLQGFGGDGIGVLALSRRADESLAARREALRALLLTALVTTALVGGLAVLLGRRTVEPVRRLTDAAERIGAGDLTATAGVRSRDEVGTLSRTFDVMTGSLARATAELRESAGRLATVLASMSDGLVATDGEGRVTSVNPAACAMAGVSDEADVVGRPLAEVLDVVDAAGEQLADPSLRLRDAPGELRPGGGGAAVPVRVAITPLQSGDGVVVVLRDTTREREVERMKTEFLSNVSHELRTPLTPIRGYADLLVHRGGTLTPEQVATFSGTILAESLKMNRVVDLLVDVASIEAGRVQVTPRAIDVRELVDDVLETWRGRAPARAEDLRRRLARGLPAVMVDPMWVRKALDELLDNAVKHTPAGTPILLLAALSPDGRGVRVTVKDSGPGIAEAAQELLFTSFEQVDGSATRRVGGLGLGLSFVRRLCDDAGFPLTFESRVGQGSEFSLDLPATDERPGPLRRGGPAKKAPAKKAPAKKAPAKKAPVKRAPAD